MTNNVCAGCRDNPTRDTLTICQRCENQTRYGLADQASHHRELVVALTRMVRMSAGNNGSSRSANRTLAWATMGERFIADITANELREIAATLPPARAAADAMHSQRSLLVSWCRLLNEEGIAQGLPANTIPAMACFIEQHLPVLRKHECAGELVFEVRDLNRRIMKVIDAPEMRAQILVGPCVVEDDNGEICPGEIKLLVPRDNDDTRRPKLCCMVCGAEWPNSHWMRLGEMIGQRKRVDQLRKVLLEQVSA